MKALTRSATPLALALTLALTACGGNGTAPAGEPAAAPTESAAPAPAASGRVIEVKMLTEGASNRFEPAEVRAKPGDVVRFVLVSGVHNVSFPATQNDGDGALPAASSFLASPGQTFDVPVALAPGQYRFQCDPHVAMGMVGTLIVE